MKNLTKNPIKKLLAVVTFVGATSTGAIAAPRTLANGAPAPGNTVAKGYNKSERTAARQLAQARQELAYALAEEQQAKQQLASTPRTLPNGAPACGNTGGKAPACTEARAESAHRYRVDRVKAAEKAVLAARARVHEITRKVALYNVNGGSYATTSDEDDDYS